MANQIDYQNQGLSTASAQPRPNYPHAGNTSGHQGGYTSRGSGYSAGPVVTAGKGMSASDTLANIYRRDWNDYIRDFQPYDQRMVDLATGDKDNQEAIQRAGESAGLAFNSANETYQRDLSRMGLSEETDERADRENRTARNKTAAKLTARNQARLHTQSRDQNLLGGNLAVGLRDMDAMGG